MRLRAKLLWRRIYSRTLYKPYNDIYRRTSTMHSNVESKSPPCHCCHEAIAHLARCCVGAAWQSPMQHTVSHSGFYATCMALHATQESLTTYLAHQPTELASIKTLLYLQQRKPIYKRKLSILSCSLRCTRVAGLTPECACHQSRRHATRGSWQQRSNLKGTSNAKHESNYVHSMVSCAASLCRTLACRHNACT